MRIKHENYDAAMHEAFEGREAALPHIEAALARGDRPLEWAKWIRSDLPESDLPGGDVSPVLMLHFINAALGGYSFMHLPKVQAVLPPQVCKRCNMKNDFAGPEHLSADGTYTCRGCK